MPGAGGETGLAFDDDVDDGVEADVDPADALYVDGMPPHPAKMAVTRMIRHIFTKFSSFGIQAHPRDTCREHAAEPRADLAELF